MGRSFLEDVTGSAFMMSQIAFLLFVATTAWAAWHEPVTKEHHNNYASGSACFALPQPARAFDFARFSSSSASRMLKWCPLS